jgi:transglutaminase-like putative cysteine protease
LIGFLDDAATEWDPALETRYRLQQTIRYAYPGTVTDLRQRLMVVPRSRHGDQSRMRYDVTTSARGARHREHIDPFGNVITDVHVDVVRDEIEFEVSSLLSRTNDGRLDVVRAWRCFATPTALTAPDDDLREAARELAGRALVGIELAEHICDWVGSTMRYEEGATAVDTTAAVAFGLRRGVCQDFAHVMVTLCRLAGMPARYVSGHLLGEGGSHAWVEVLVPDANRSRSRVAHAFDPTERDRTGSRHLTVAVGRDYADVAPMSGTYNASIPGTLAVTKRAGLANLDSPS